MIINYWGEKVKNKYTKKKNKVFVKYFILRKSKLPENKIEINLNFIIINLLKFLPLLMTTTYLHFNKFVDSISSSIVFLNMFINMIYLIIPWNSYFKKKIHKSFYKDEVLGKNKNSYHYAKKFFENVQSFFLLYFIYFQGL